MAASASRRASLRRFGGRVDGVANARRVWHRRDSLLLRLEDGDFVGFGEASPLSGYSPDWLDDVEAQLLQWIHEGCPTDSGGLESPAARCAIESASWDVRAQQAEMPLWRLWRRDGRAKTLPVAGLIAPGDMGATLRRGRELVDSGITTLKLKVGADTQPEAARLQALRREFGERVRLRLDANRSIPPESAAETLVRWADYDIEFIEEPTDDSRAIRDSPIPLALDESLQGSGTAEQIWRRWSDWIPSANCTALVLKPTALGLEKSLALARRAARAELQVVVSHCFEGPLALQVCAHLALAVGGNLAQGLARHPGLDPWPESDGLMVSESQIDPARCQGDGLGLDCEALWSAAEPVSESQ